MITVDDARSANPAPELAHTPHGECDLYTRQQHRTMVFAAISHSRSWADPAHDLCGGVSAHRGVQASPQLCWRRIVVLHWRRRYGDVVASVLPVGNGTQYIDRESDRLCNCTICVSRGRDHGARGPETRGVAGVTILAVRTHAGASRTRLFATACAGKVQSAREPVAARVGRMASVSQAASSDLHRHAIGSSHRSRVGLPRARIAGQVLGNRSDILRHSSGGRGRWIP